MTDAEILSAVRERIDLGLMETTKRRRRESPHVYTAVHRRYWNERIALDSLRDGMTLADLLASEHGLVREAALFALATSPVDSAVNGPPTLLGHLCLRDAEANE